MFHLYSVRMSVYLPNLKRLKHHQYKLQKKNKKQK